MLDQLCGHTLKPMDHQIITVPVTKDLGVDVNMTAHVLTGREPGPTLLITSMLHGEEWFSVLIIRALFKALDLSKLKGTVIAIPVANESAFNTNTRCVMDNSDEPDANRSFDGRYNCLTNLICRCVEENFLSKADYLIDYHVGTWGNRMADIGYGSDYPDAELVRISRGMAKAYCFPVLHAMRLNQGTHSARNAMGCAGLKYGVPAIVPEIGGLGFGQAQEDAWIQDNIRGLLGNLSFLGMLEGEIPYCEKYLEVGEYFRVSPKNGGYVELALPSAGALTPVKRDQLLARVIDPKTFQVLEELRSPCDGMIFYGCRNYMVRPGGWVFGVANMEHNCSKWVGAD